MFASDYKKKIGDLIWFGYVISFQRIHSFPYKNTSIIVCCNLKRPSDPVIKSWSAGQSFASQEFIGLSSQTVVFRPRLCESCCSFAVETKDKTDESGIFGG